MTTHEIATALTNATETEKAAFAQFLMDTLAPHGLSGNGEVKRALVAAFDRYVAPESISDSAEDML